MNTQDPQSLKGTQGNQWALSSLVQVYEYSLEPSACKEHWGYIPSPCWGQLLYTAHTTVESSDGSAVLQGMYWQEEKEQTTKGSLQKREQGKKTVSDGGERADTERQTWETAGQTAGQEVDSKPQAE